MWAPIFEWGVVRCRSQNGHQNEMRLKEIGLHVCAQNILSILGSIVCMIRGTYMTIQCAQESSLWSWIRYSYDQPPKLWGKWLQLALIDVSYPTRSGRRDTVTEYEGPHRYLNHLYTPGQCVLTNWNSALIAVTRWNHSWWPTGSRGSEDDPWGWCQTHASPKLAKMPTHPSLKKTRVPTFSDGHCAGDSKLAGTRANVT